MRVLMTTAIVALFFGFVVPVERANLWRLLYAISGACTAAALIMFIWSA